MRSEERVHSYANERGQVGSCSPLLPGAAMERLPRGQAQGREGMRSGVEPGTLGNLGPNTTGHINWER